MNIKDLLREDDAVSPVIGVILMVAITVILAAVIGTFVLGLGDQVQSSAPNANFQFEYEDITYTESSNVVDTIQITITHNGGQDVDASNVNIQVAGNTAFGLDDSADQAVQPFASGTLSTGSSDTVAMYDSGTSITDGSGITVNTTPNPNELSGDATRITGGEDVLVIWESPSGDSSNTIGSSTVPN